MMNKSSMFGRMCLIAAAIIWGGSFVFMKQSVDVIHPYPLLAFRFTVGAVLLSLIFFRRLKSVGRQTLAHGAVIGVLLAMAYITQTWGLADTTPGKNAFLTAVYCVMVPFINRILFRSKTKPDNWIAALMCLAGIGLVSLTGDLTIRRGDALTLLGGVFYALHLIAVSRFSEKDDAIVLTILQFAVAAILCAGLTAIKGVMTARIPVELLPQLLYLAVAATTLALLLQNIGQSRTPAAQASILLSLQSVFGVLFSVLMGVEMLTMRILIGFVVIFAGVLVGETECISSGWRISPQCNSKRNG